MLEIDKNYELSILNINDININYALYKNTIYYYAKDILILAGYKDTTKNITSYLKTNKVDDNFVIKILPERGKIYVSSYGLDQSLIYKKINNKKIVNCLKSNQSEMRKAKKATLTLTENEELVIDNSSELELLEKISKQNEELLNNQKNNHSELTDRQNEIIKKNEESYNLIQRIFNYIKNLFSGKQKNNKNGLNIFNRP